MSKMSQEYEDQGNSLYCEAIKFSIGEFKVQGAILVLILTYCTCNLLYEIYSIIYSMNQI